MNNENNELLNNEQINNVESVTTPVVSEPVVNNEVPTNIPTEITETPSVEPIETSTPVVNEEIPTINEVPVQESVQETPVAEIPTETPVTEVPPISEPQVSIPTNNEPILSNEKKKKKPIIIIALLAILLIGGIIIGIIFLTGNDSDGASDEKNISSSFFIENNNKYALFNSNGKKLTDFIFDDYYDFYKDVSLVQKGDNKGLINTKGKMVIDFGKYKSIKQYKAVYEVTTEDSKSYLINNKGKELYNLTNNELVIIGTTDSYSLVKLISKGKYEVINNANGKVITTFDASNDQYEDPVGNIDDDDRYVSIYYNSINHIIDLKNNKEVINFKDEKHFCVSDNGTDNDIVLSSCKQWYESNDDPEFRLVRNGNLVDLTDKCDGGLAIFDEIVRCYNKDEKFVLNSDNSIGLKITEYMSFIDSENYVLQEYGHPSKVVFYENKKELKKIECKSIRNNENEKYGLYLVVTEYDDKCSDPSGMYELYNTKGEKIGKTYKTKPIFDKDSLAIVSEDGENYYLIDTKGNKVSDNYDYISKGEYSGLYIVEKNEKGGILDTEGKKIIDTIYDDMTLYKVYGTNIILVEKGDSYIIIDVNSKKEIIHSNVEPEIYDNYFIINENNKTKHYTFNGKMFFEK